MNNIKNQNNHSHHPHSHLLQALAFLDLNEHQTHKYQLKDKTFTLVCFPLGNVHHTKTPFTSSHLQVQS